MVHTYVIHTYLIEVFEELKAMIHGCIVEPPAKYYMHAHQLTVVIEIDKITTYIQHFIY